MVFTLYQITISGIYLVPGDNQWYLPCTRCYLTLYQVASARGVLTVHSRITLCFSRAVRSRRGRTIDTGSSGEREREGEGGRGQKGREGERGREGGIELNTRMIKAPNSMENPAAILVRYHQQLF